MHNNPTSSKNNAAGLVTCLALMAIISGCAKPYIQTPEIVGDNPATLELYEGTLKSEGYGKRMFSVHKRELSCDGVGPADINVNYLGRFYDDTGFTKAKHTKIQIPTDSDIIIRAYYTLQNLIKSTYCDISIKFSPEAGATYLFFTKREQEAGWFAGAGKCHAAVFRQYRDDKDGKEKLVEVQPVLWGPLQAFKNHRLFCDKEGNVLTEKEWQQRKPKNVNSPSYREKGSSRAE